MPYEIIRNDITKMKVDAIVNAANESLLGGGGVDGCIHRAAGPGLLAECRKLHGCKTGDAKITGAYDLPCRYVIHTVGPVWNGGKYGEEELLISCYWRSLELAKENGCKTVAFPLISAGVYGYPKDRALKVAIETICDFLLENDMLVYIVIFDKKSLFESEKLHRYIAQYIDDETVEALEDDREIRMSRMAQARCILPKSKAEMTDEPVCFGTVPLKDKIRDLDESFSQAVLRLIDEKKMTDVECYKKANMSRQHFSKLRGNPHYNPSKRTALALAIALELSRDEMDALLEKAGYALSHANVGDLIIEWFVEQGKYDIHDINIALFEYDQQLLGA